MQTNIQHSGDTRSPRQRKQQELWQQLGRLHRIRASLDVMLDQKNLEWTWYEKESVYKTMHHLSDKINAVRAQMQHLKRIPND